MSRLHEKEDLHTWALVLAAGDGSRLSTLTTDARGVTVPKQFCSLNGAKSLLEIAIRRARVVVPRERICVIVADGHRAWWRDQLKSLPPRNVIVQPRNRGTANGILLPALGILARDPEARLLVLPSDHFVSNERALTKALLEAAQSLPFGSGDLILLGIAPEEPDPELGYIVPDQTDGRETLPVRQFVEKPPRPLAARLVADGGLWNSLIFAVNAHGVVHLFRQGYPGIVAAMQAAVDVSGDLSAPAAGLCALYDRLPAVDFSRDLLERATGRLRVHPVPCCGWTDLGTVPRVVSALRRLSAPAKPGRVERGIYSLASAVRRLPPDRIGDDRPRAVA